MRGAVRVLDCDRVEDKKCSCPVQPAFFQCETNLSNEKCCLYGLKELWLADKPSTSLPLRAIPPDVFCLQHFEETHQYLHKHPIPNSALVIGVPRAFEKPPTRISTHLHTAETLWDARQVDILSLWHVLQEQRLRRSR
ncbi:hypothetical protein AVEN_28790-1 [Araneus ventricosus]|uniref:Uncharacterized protein n=1 Tax=Araneus ventricosus TaxID=182803 RepID=A0A4Y2SZQ7_ARAVE|nr:hypothetical protein AVEN_28790-1 [Araneus ventricosus]